MMQKKGTNHQGRRRSRSRKYGGELGRGWERRREGERGEKAREEQESFLSEAKNVRRPLVHYLRYGWATQAIIIFQKSLKWERVGGEQLFMQGDALFI
jgi:hypothetical protein